MVRSTGRGGGDDPHQFQIEWSVAAASTSPPPPRPPQTNTADLLAPPPPLVQRLPWDFRTCFPQPTDEAIENGVLDESDREPENVKALHANYAAHCLATLTALDQITQARRMGIDPATGKKPRTHAARERLRKYLDEEPLRLQHAFDVLIDTYGEAFGQDAADAFRKAINAWHARIEVIVEHPTDSAPEPQADRKKRVPRASSCLPVPRPLHASVAAGAFGHDEDGKPIRPTAEEVRAMTEQHAEKLVEMLDGLQEIETWLSSSQCSDRARLYHERDALHGKVKSAIAAYAEDFGPRAAQQLEAYARRHAGLLHPPVPSRRR